LRFGSGKQLKFLCTVTLAVGLLLLAAGNRAAAQAPVISKVEPPSWWSNHTINPVRLLIRGRNLTGARVSATRSETILSDVRINRNGTYLFVNVRIGPTARPGEYPLIVETTQGKSNVPFSLNAPLDAQQDFQGVNNDDVIYLIMTDRFSDGDPSNNSPPGAPVGAFDRKNARAYHGGDFRGVINHLPYLKELGVTAIWLTPWYDNWNGVKECDKPWCPSTYYHGYHAIDYYGVEDHFGDLNSLRELIGKAHALGLKVIQDQVANHIGAHHPWANDPPLDDWFHGTMQKHDLNKFQNSVLLSPHANQEEVRNTLDGWFSDDMPDMNQDEPEVARYEIQNSLWWIGMTGIDGIRQDTIQYTPRSFIRDLENALQRQYPRMWMVGEVFERDAAQAAYFIGGHTGWDGIDTKLDSDFDFALWYTSIDVFTRKLPMRALRNQLKYDALFPDASKLTTLTNNHDTRRFMSVEGATLEGAMLHTAFILTVRGTPQLYSGEEIAMEGKDDPDNRRDFPGGFPGDERNAFTGAGRTGDQQRMWDWTHDWIKLRQEHSALRQGRLIDLFYDDDAYIYARQDKTETVIVVFNRSSAEKRINLPLTLLGRQVTRLVQLIGNQTRVSTNGEFTIPARTAAAFSLD
jgi:glycosidase